MRLGIGTSVFMPERPVVVWTITTAIVIVVSAFAKMFMREMAIGNEGVSIFRTPPKSESYGTTTNPTVHRFAKSAAVIILVGTLEILGAMGIKRVPSVRYCTVSIHDVVSVARPIGLADAAEIDICIAF